MSDSLSWRRFGESVFTFTDAPYGVELRLRNVRAEDGHVYADLFAYERYGGDWAKVLVRPRANLTSVRTIPFADLRPGMAECRRTPDGGARGFAEIRAARRMLCRSRMAKSTVRRVAEYVTRKPFRKFAKAVDKRFDAVDKRFDAVDKRFDAADERFDRLIETLGETIANAVKMLRTEIRSSYDDLRVELSGQIRTSHDELRAELGADMTLQILASEERMRAEIRAMNDPYRDLPERVARLEAHTGLR